MVESLYGRNLGWVILVLPSYGECPNRKYTHWILGEQGNLLKLCVTTIPVDGGPFLRTPSSFDSLWLLRGAWCIHWSLIEVYLSQRQTNKTIHSEYIQKEEMSILMNYLKGWVTLEPKKNLKGKSKRKFQLCKMWDCVVHRGGFILSLISL